MSWRAWLAARMRTKGMGRFSHYDGQQQFSIEEAASLAAGLSPERTPKSGDVESETRYREYLKILSNDIDAGKLKAKKRRHAFLAGVRIDEDRPETLEDAVDWENGPGWFTATTEDGREFYIAATADEKTTLIDRADLVAFFAAVDGGDSYFCATPAEAERSPINPNDNNYAPRLHMAWLVWQGRHVTGELAAERDIPAWIEDNSQRLVGEFFTKTSAALEINRAAKSRDGKGK